MFVETTKSTVKGKTYECHLLRETFRVNGEVKHRTILNLSPFPKEEVEAIRFALKHKKHLYLLTNIEDIEITQGPRIGAVLSLHSLARQLGLAQVLGQDQQGKLALWQVMARMIDQGSRLSAVRLASTHSAVDLLGMAPFDEDDLYGNLKWLSHNQERIEKELFRLRYQDAPPQLFLYDVTSSYLEGAKNILASFGYNRDGKKGKTQLVIGLLTGPDGTPVAVRVFEGNTQDTKTVATQIQILAKNFGVSEVTLVGDRGMLKGPQKELLEAGGFHWITALTKAQIESKLGSGLFQMSLFDEQLIEVCEEGPDGVRYVLRRNPCRVEDMARSRESKLKKVRAKVEDRNLYLENHPRAKVSVAQRLVVTLVEKLKLGKLIKTETESRSLKIVVDEEALKKESKLDGCYVITTDVNPQAASKEEIHQRYKDLAHVEKAFRTFKTGHLEIRPVFVRSEASTRGHVFVVMLAYLLEKELSRRWISINKTVAEGIDELGSLRSVFVKLKDKDQSFQEIPEVQGDMKALLDAAQVELPPFLPMPLARVATKKSLVSERKS